jgi:hypothetical protein
MSEIIDLNVWLDAKRKKDIESFKIKHPAQYACIKELGRKQGALEELKRIEEAWHHIGSKRICNYIEKRIKELERVEQK